MTHSPASLKPTLETLLEHGGWVRALARSLVTDESTALDLEQKTWLAAIERPPEHLSNPRAWLGAVVRNLAGMHWREQKARNKREDVVRERRWQQENMTEDARQPDGLVERVDTFQILAHAMAELDEPFATTLYLRFFEELPIRDIAERMKAPESTTNKRLSRGLELLRHRLESSIGKDWRASCLAIASPLAVGKAAATGTVIFAGMKISTWIAASLVVGLSTATFYSLEKENPNQTEPANLVAAVESSKTGSEATTQVSASIERVLLDLDSSEKFPNANPPDAAETVRIKVLGPEGMPVAHVPVALVFKDGDNGVEELQRALSDEDGIVNLSDPSAHVFTTREYMVGFPFYSKGTSEPISFLRTAWPTETQTLRVPVSGQGYFAGAKWRALASRNPTHTKLTWRV